MNNYQSIGGAYWICFAPSSTARHDIFLSQHTVRDAPPWRKVGKDRRTRRKDQHLWDSNPRPPNFEGCALPLCYNLSPLEKHSSDFKFIYQLMPLGLSRKVVGLNLTKLMCPEKIEIILICIKHLVSLLSFIIDEMFYSNLQWLPFVIYSCGVLFL